MNSKQKHQIQIYVDFWRASKQGHQDIRTSNQRWSGSCNAACCFFFPPSNRYRPSIRKSHSHVQHVLWRVCQNILHHSITVESSEFGFWNTSWTRGPSDYFAFLDFLALFPLSSALLTFCFLSFFSSFSFFCFCQTLLSHLKSFCCPSPGPFLHSLPRKPQACSRHRQASVAWNSFPCRNAFGCAFQSCQALCHHTLGRASGRRRSE